MIDLDDFGVDPSINFRFLFLAEPDPDRV